MTAKEYSKIIQLIKKIHEHTDEDELRHDLAKPLLDLLGADYFASFCWDAENACYTRGVYLNMSTQNIGRYSEYFQYRDPITRRLAQRRSTTLVSEIMPHKELQKTEFFNDFLLADGLYHGVNLHLYDGETNIGDLRIWRRRGRGEFDETTRTQLELLKPHLINAIRRIRQKP